ncbi:MAG: protein kinase [Kofleriaceae bacterium]
MGGPAAEQTIAGVALGERLAVTMYGAVHRADFAGMRNMRALVVDAKLLAERGFRGALSDTKAIAAAIGLTHPNIVSTVAVEANGSDVVIVMRGHGRYVTLQDVIASARADRSQGGKLAVPIAAAITRSVVEALAAAHRAGVVHGAVHPRSVLIDEDGTVRLGDFVVGRALTATISQATSSAWRGLAGFVAPELTAGHALSPAADVFSVGALLFTMISGEVPPGTLHVTPAIERLVQRALDNDVTRRYSSATMMLDNLLEAFEDDRWTVAERAALIKAAGLSRAGTNVDDATEELLASLGSSAVQVTPARASGEIRLDTSSGIKPQRAGTGARLDALLADLDEAPDVGGGYSRAKRPSTGRSELIGASRARVPSLDDPDDLTPLPAPIPDWAIMSGEHEIPRSSTKDEAAAMDALADLDGPVRRVSTAAEQASAAAIRLEQAAQRAEAAAARVGTADPAPQVRGSTPRVARPSLEEMPHFEVPPPRIKSRVLGIVGVLAMLGGGAAFYMVYKRHEQQSAEAVKAQQDREKDAEDKTRLAIAAQADRGTLSVTANPSSSSVWLKLGRTNLTTFPLTATQIHRIRIELPGYQSIDTEVLGANWSQAGATAGSGAASGSSSSIQRKAIVRVTLQAAAKDKHGNSLAKPLPALPPNLAVDTKALPAGEGPIEIETTPPGAEVWLLIGFANTGVSFPTIAGRAYELRALSDGFLPGYAQVSAEEWRAGGDPNVPIDVAEKRATIEKRIELAPDPNAKPSKKGR